MRSLTCIKFQNEPVHYKTSILICLPRKDSDQTGHPHSLVSVFALHIQKLGVLSFLLATVWRSDMTGLNRGG